MLVYTYVSYLGAGRDLNVHLPECAPSSPNYPSHAPQVSLHPRPPASVLAFSLKKIQWSHGQFPFAYHSDIRLRPSVGFTTVCLLHRRSGRSAARAHFLHFPVTHLFSISTHSSESVFPLPQKSHQVALVLTYIAFCVHIVP